MSTQQALALPPSGSTAVVINGRAMLRVEGEQRVVIVAGLPVHAYGASDPVAEAYAMVFLVDSGFAQQNEVARVPRAWGGSNGSRRKGWETARSRGAWE